MDQYYYLTRKRFQQNGIAEAYAKKRFGTLKGRFLKYREERIVRRILEAIGRQGKILDIPCGTGRFSLLIKDHADLTVGADLSAPMLEYSRKNGKYSEVHRCEIEHMPFPDNHFDVLMCFRLLHHLSAEDREKAFAEVYRVTQKYFVFTFNSKHSLGYLVNNLVLKKPFYSETLETVRGELRKYFHVTKAFRILPLVAGETIVFCEKKR